MPEKAIALPVVAIVRSIAAPTGRRSTSSKKRLMMKSE